ncbi:MAG TPA: styrene monooxygenase/indole monooxygenase family protein [Thermoanaerobaculia bacterium]|jgi:2-polyprenyl-6-methoxyphenol hydroxylase-like FAD-dependent oxidoreductase|nr:styrene monooxygenase/indole monooxygenase family protein [Thermoanaerobaculia bacterium]
MRKIAIVGAGQAGLQFGFGLLQHGYDVSVYSDRTPEDILNGPVLATAFMFDRGLSYERELGLNFWDDEVRWGEGIHLDFCIEPNNLLFKMEGRFHAPGHAVDQRLKFSRWMHEFEARGGHLFIEPVDIETLERLTASHDLVVVASGKGEISSLFRRDPVRSAYTKPQRKLILLTLSGVKPWGEIPFYPVKFTFSATDGEIFWVPFHDRRVGTCYSLLIEAQMGKGMDRFDGVEDGEDAVEVARQILADIAPWELEHFRDVKLIDRGFRKAMITPIVREPVGTLPSGRIVMGIGDAIVLNDPIAGQGANCASKAAHFMTQRVLEREDRRFDAPWMQQSFDDFWERDAKFITAFSNMFLEPVTPAAKEVLLAGSMVPEIAEEFFDNFNDPQRFWPWIQDLHLARRHVAEKSGGPWWKTALTARLAVLRGQVQQQVQHRLAHVATSFFSF